MSVIPDLSKPSSASLKPVLFIDEVADEPFIAYSDEAATMQHVTLTGGFIKSLDPKNYPFDAQIVHGGDDITLREGIPNIGHLDCRIYLKFNNDSTKRGFLSYSGVVKMSGATADVVDRKKSLPTFEEGYVTCHPHFSISKDLKLERWVDTTNFMAKGRFLRDEKGVLRVQYWIYILEE